MGRHQWRCKAKLRQQEGYNVRPEEQMTVDVNDQIASQTENLLDEAVSAGQEQDLNPQYVHCCCGKRFKGIRGLKAHQRTCRFIKGLNDELYSVASNETDHDNDLPNCVDELVLCDMPEIKPGVKLPSTDAQWKEADLYFRAELPLCELNNASLNDCVAKMMNIIYDYFAVNFGTIARPNASDKALRERYVNYSKHQLKRELKTLKHQSPGDLESIRYVFKLLRNKATCKFPCNEYSTDHNREIKKDFWRYTTKYLDTDTNPCPTFNSETCTKYFKNIWRRICPDQVFVIPNWLPNLLAPKYEFQTLPPTYSQITRIIRLMKPNGSACPLDQISIIPFKRSAYLRSYLTAVIEQVWTSGKIPDAWKKAITILIHKKDTTDKPDNFRPITLQSIPFKVFTSAMRNRMYEFLSTNSFIENSVQKGFTPGVSGTFEHTAQLAYIRQAKKQQRSLIVTWLDLKNAFGEVHHRLIPAVLRYHQIPEHFIECIGDIYCNFYSSVIAESYHTPFIPVKREFYRGIVHQI